MVPNWSLGFRQGAFCKKQDEQEKSRKLSMITTKSQFVRKDLNEKENFLDEIIQEDRISLCSTCDQPTHTL